MTITTRLSKLFGSILIAVIMSAAALLISSIPASATAPAPASAAKYDSGGLSATAAIADEKGPGGAEIDAAVCVGPFIINFTTDLYQCNVITTTAFRATCSTGVQLGPLVLPPGRWDITVNCVPGFPTSFTFTDA